MTSSRGLAALRHATMALAPDSDAALAFLLEELAALRAAGDSKGVLVVARHTCVAASSRKAHELALALAREVAALPPDDAFAHAALAETCSDAGRRDEASEAFERAATLAADDEPELARTLRDRARRLRDAP